MSMKTCSDNGRLNPLSDVKEPQIWQLHTVWKAYCDKDVRGNLYSKNSGDVSRDRTEEINCQKRVTGVSSCHTIHLQSGSVICHAGWIASSAGVVTTMSSRHRCYYQHTDTITNLGSCQSHVGGEFTPMETPWQLQGAVTLWHVASQLGIVAWIGFPIERKWDDVGQDWVKQHRKLHNQAQECRWADKCVRVCDEHESNWPKQKNYSQFWKQRTDHEFQIYIKKRSNVFVNN
jgi:hypothetical protein